MVLPQMLKYVRPEDLLLPIARRLGDGEMLILLPTIQPPTTARIRRQTPRKTSFWIRVMIFVNMGRVVDWWLALAL